MTNPNDSAFAKSAFYHENGGVDSPEKGLTKREYFAAMAMQGLLSAKAYGFVNIDVYARDAVKYADALIEQLNKEK